LLNFFSLDVSSNSNSTSQAKHLKCVVCYPLTPNAGHKKGLISYRSANGIFTLQKHLEDNHQELWGEWIK
jgi:hypothetical protein